MRAALLIAPWDYFDTAWYSDIAAHDYVRFGSTAFMPLYPLLMRLLAPVTAGDLVAAGLAISAVAAFFAFQALYLLATWCVSQLKVLSTGLTASEARYMLQLFPLVLLPAGWLAHGGPLRWLAWLSAGIILASACLWAFTLAAWVP